MNMITPYGTIAGLAWRQYLNRFDVILLGHTVFSLPVLAVAWYFKQWFPLTAYWPNLAIHFGLDYIGSILTCITTIWLLLAMQSAVQRKPVRLGKLLRQALPLYPAAVLVSLLDLLATATGLAVLIIPGIMISVLLAFALPALIWYRLSPWQAMLRSIVLVRRHFWLTAFYILLTQFIVSLVVMITTWGLPTTMWFNIFSSWVGVICASFYTVFVTILMTLSEKK